MKFLPKILRLVLPVAFLELAFGGDSESSSSTSTTSNQYDQRATSGADGVSISGSGNVITRTTTDLGAVKAGTELSRQALVLGLATADSFASNTKAIFDSSLNELGKAYETAKAGDQRVVSMVGLAVIGLAAVFIAPAVLKKG